MLMILIICFLMDFRSLSEGFKRKGRWGAVRFPDATPRVRARFFLHLRGESSSRLAEAFSARTRRDPNEARGAGGDRACATRGV